MRGRGRLERWRGWGGRGRRHGAGRTCVRDGAAGRSVLHQPNLVRPVAWPPVRFVEPLPQEHAGKARLPGSVILLRLRRSRGGGNWRAGRRGCGCAYRRSSQHLLQPLLVTRSARARLPSRKASRPSRAACRLACSASGSGCGNADMRLTAAASRLSSGAAAPGGGTPASPAEEPRGGTGRSATARAPPGWAAAVGTMAGAAPAGGAVGLPGDDAALPDAVSGAGAASAGRAGAGAGIGLGGDCGAREVRDARAVKARGAAGAVAGGGARPIAARVSRCWCSTSEWKACWVRS